MSRPATSPADVVRSLVAHDMVRVTFPDGKSRTVRITQTEGRNAYTTSGRVRAGHVKGGVLSTWTNKDGSEVATFQATMLQQVRYVSSIERLGAAN